MSTEALRWAVRCREIHDGPRLVLFALAWLADGGGFGETQIEEIGYIAAQSRGSVQRHLRVLEASGLVSRAPQSGRGRKSPFRLSLETASALMPFSDDDASENASALIPFSDDDASENVSTLMPIDGETASTPMPFAAETASENVSTLMPNAENASENVSTLMPIDDETASENASELMLNTRVSLKHKETRINTARSARAREVDAYVPSAAANDRLLARGFSAQRLGELLASYKRLRMTALADDISDDNYVNFGFWYAKKNAIDLTERDVRVQRDAKITESNRINTRQWQSRERQR